MADFMSNRACSVFENVGIALTRLYSSGNGPTGVRVAFEVERGVQHDKYVFACPNAAVSGQACLGDPLCEIGGPIWTALGIWKLQPTGC
jgi:hypothetical protein